MECRDLALRHTSSRPSQPLVLVMSGVQNTSSHASLFGLVADDGAGGAVGAGTSRATTGSSISGADAAVGAGTSRAGTSRAGTSRATTGSSAAGPATSSAAVVGGSSAAGSATASSSAGCGVARSRPDPGPSTGDDGRRHHTRMRRTIKLPADQTAGWSHRKCMALKRAMGMSTSSSYTDDRE